MATVSKREWTYKGETKTAWIVRYMEGGKHRQKTFERKRDAETYRQKVEREVFEGVHVAASASKTVDAACEAFLRHTEDRLRIGAIGRNRLQSLTVHIERSVKPHLGHVMLTNLTALRLEEWFFAMIRKDNLNPRTARDRFRTFRMVEKFAVSRGWLRKPVSAEAAKVMSGIERPKVRTFSAEDVQHLLSIVNARGAHKRRPSEMMACFVHIATFCGLRYGEIVGLSLDNIDFESRIIFVRQSLPHWDELKGPKTKAGVRELPMPQHVADLLRKWIAEHYIANDRNLIFRTGKGGRVMGDNFNEMWRSLLKRAGLLDGGKVFHFHALRHFASSWMIENSLSLLDVAMLMGHEKFDMTLQVYAHPVTNKATHHHAFEKMASRLTPVPAVLDYARLTHDHVTN